MTSRTSEIDTKFSIQPDPYNPNTFHVNMEVSRDTANNPHAVAAIQHVLARFFQGGRVDEQGNVELQLNFDRFHITGEANQPPEVTPEINSETTEEHCPSQQVARHFYRVRKVDDNNIRMTYSLGGRKIATTLPTTTFNRWENNLQASLKPKIMAAAIQRRNDSILNGENPIARQEQQDETTVILLNNHIDTAPALINPTTFEHVIAQPNIIQDIGVHVSQLHAQHKSASVTLPGRAANGPSQSR